MSIHTLNNPRTLRLLKNINLQLFGCLSSYGYNYITIETLISFLTGNFHFCDSVDYTFLSDSIKDKFSNKLQHIHFHQVIVIFIEKNIKAFWKTFDMNYNGFTNNDEFVMFFGDPENIKLKYQNIINDSYENVQHAIISDYIETAQLYINICTKEEY